MSSFKSKFLEGNTGLIDNLEDILIYGRNINNNITFGTKDDFLILNKISYQTDDILNFTNNDYRLYFDNKNIQYLEDETMIFGKDHYLIENNTEIFRSGLLLYSNKKSLILKFQAKGNSGTETLNVILEGYDSNLFLTTSIQESFNLTTNWQEFTVDRTTTNNFFGGFFINNSLVKYIQIKITFPNATQSNTVSFGFPKLFSKARDYEYYFGISRTGSGGWSIIENTNELLSSASTSGDEVIFNFDSSFNINNENFKIEAIPFCFDNSENLYYSNVMFGETGSTINVGINSLKFSFNNILRFQFYTFTGVFNTVLTNVSINDNIGSNINFIKIRIKRI